MEAVPHYGNTALGFSRDTKHETRLFLRRGCASDAQSEPPARTAAHAARSPLSCALLSGMGRLWRGMGGRGPSPAPATRPGRFYESRLFSKHVPYALRYAEGAPCGEKAELKVVACISHHPTAEARGMTARTSLRLLAVLNVLSSTPARAKRLAPRPDGPLTHFASPRGEKCRAEPKTEIRHPDLRARYQVTACLPAIGRDWLAFLLPGHGFTGGCFPLFPVISRGVGGAPEQVFKRRSLEIPEKCTKSRFSQENA